MVTSLIAYVVGFLVCVWALTGDSEDYRGLTRKARCKAFLGTVGVSLLWPAAGAWFLWELFGVWRTSMRDPREGDDI